MKEGRLMSKFADRLRYAVIQKNPMVKAYWTHFKELNNAYFYSKRTKSRIYLFKLYFANLLKQDLSCVQLPRDCVSFLGIKSSSGKCENPDKSCKAVPDSNLLQRKTPEEFVAELKDFDVISFDIFDTCIFRPVNKPTDIFYLLEAQTGVLDFCKLRKRAEELTRQKGLHPNFEVNISEIYEELALHTSLIKKVDAEKEINLELSVCYANPYMLKVFNMLKDLGKEIIAISDMYLPSSVISQILNKNGFNGFSKIIVSCEHGCNKANGLLFNYAKQLFSKDTKIAHIGDNYNVDILAAARQGITAFHYLQCNEYGNRFRPSNVDTPYMSLYKGLVNNYLYNGETHNLARKDFGYIYAGPIVCGFCEWLNTYVKNNKFDKILFMARDMHIFYKIYNKYYVEYSNEYIVISRFALQELLIKDFPDEYVYHTILVRTDRGYTIQRTFEEIGLSSLLKYCSDYKLFLNDFIIASNREKVEQIIKDHIDEAVEVFKNNEKAAILYFKKVINGAKKICLVDLGWRGSIIAYLRYLLVDKWKLCDEVKGVMLGSSVNETSKNLISRGLVDTYAYNHVFNRNYLRSNTWSQEYITILTLESIFTSTEESLLEYRINEENNVDFIYLGKNPNKEIVIEIQSGIEEFASQLNLHRSRYINYLPITPVDAFEPINNILDNYEYIARIIGDILDTPYQVAGLDIMEEKYVTIGELIHERNLISQWPIQ